MIDEMFSDEFNAIFVPNTSTYKFGKGEPVVCHFNKSIDCKDHSRCAKCGWNPAVAEIRSREIRRRLALEKGED